MLAARTASPTGVASAQPFRGRSRAVARPRSASAVSRGSGGRLARLAVRRRVTGGGEGQGSSNKTKAGDEEDEQVDEDEDEDEEPKDMEAEFEERAQEYARIQQRAQGLYSLGKRAYEGGAYKNAVTALEEAVDSLANLNDSGECGLWLALSYEACGRDDDALQLYLRLESHPIPSIRKQATDLRYIFEAPKLKIGDDERVSIPDLSDVDALAESRQRMTRRTQKKVELTLEERVLRDYVPPIRLPNKYIQAASLLLILGVAWYSAYIQQSL